MKFQKIFTKKSATMNSKMTLQQLIDMLNIGGVDNSRLSEATYFACLKILSESIGKLPLKLLRAGESGGVTKAYSHPIYKVVGSRPNPYMTATHFWSTVEYNRNHFGNAFVWIRGAGKKVSLWILQNSAVSIYIDDAGIWGNRNTIWYVYNDPKGAGTFKIPSDSLLHFKGSNSFDGITGESVRDTLKGTLEGNQKAQKMLNSAYDNGFTGKVVLQYTGNLSDDNETAYVKNVAKFASGESGKNIIPMPFGTSLQPLNTKLADNEFLGLKKYSALQIAAAFGIKPNQINDYEKSSYASAEAQQLAFYVDTLLYILKQYEEELGNKLLTDEELEGGYYFKFNVSAILRADLKTQIESLKGAVQGSLYTPNEARVFLDKKSLPGGDTLLCNGNMMPVSYAGKQFEKGGEKNE